MEALSLALAFLIIIFLTLSYFLFKNRSDNNSRLPPGGTGWPIVGEALYFFFNPEKFIEDRMKKHSPDIFRTNFLGEKIVVICGPNGHKFLWSNENKYFATFYPQAIQKLFLTSQPKAETIVALRGPGFLKPDALVHYISGMDSTIQQQLKIHLEGKSEVKIYPFSRTLTLTLACKFFMGMENPERIAKLIRHFDEVTEGLHTLPLNLPGTAFHRASKAAEVIRKELATVIQEKKAAGAGAGSKSQDLLSVFISGGVMSDAEIADTVMGLLVAGYGTVAIAITFFMKYVGETPDVYQVILTEQLEISKAKQPGESLTWDDMPKMKYSWAAICEVMRLTPPLLGTLREAMTDFTYAGYTVPKGWKVFWTVNTTHKNPKYFQEPNKFNPSRFMEGEVSIASFVPFGGGPRMCPRKEYARLLVLAFVHNVVKRYKWDMVYPGEKILGSMIPLPEKGLPVRLYPY